MFLKSKSIIVFSFNQGTVNISKHHNEAVVMTDGLSDKELQPTSHTHLTISYLNILNMTASVVSE